MTIIAFIMFSVALIMHWWGFAIGLCVGFVSAILGIWAREINIKGITH